MLFSLARFYFYGWIEALYILPKVHFSYYGFEWVKNPGPFGMYLLFGIAFIAVIGILLGAWYRFSIVSFFLSFTYIELIDKTNYLNHYYFISLVAFLMIFLPANRNFSIDCVRNPRLHLDKVPVWTINIIKFQLAIVYCYAGMAKLNNDWLFEAMPLKIWLKAHVDFPILGSLFAKNWVAYFFSWFGAVYDLFIVFFLMKSKTRAIAYFFVVSFHVLTWLLFPIGVFPWVMIAFSTIFMSSKKHDWLLGKLKNVFNFQLEASSRSALKQFKIKHTTVFFLVAFAFFQLLFPWRYLFYPGDLFWTEEGYRFSWRVMLMEKAGYATFFVTDPATGKKGQVFNYEYLTPQQEKMMSTQPDMIWQFAQVIKEDFENKGIKNPIVTAEAYVTLNGRRSRLILDPQVNLSNQNDSLLPKNWITSTP